MCLDTVNKCTTNIVNCKDYYSLIMKSLYFTYETTCLVRPECKSLVKLLRVIVMLQSSPTRK